MPGVEISASHPLGEAHILGYWMNYEDPEFQAFLERPRSSRASRIVEMCERLTDIGLNVRPEEVFEEKGGEGAVGRPHLAKVLLAKGYVKDMEEAFRRYLSKGCPAYVKRVKNSTVETLAMIHRCGGISVIAHPGLIKDPRIIDDLILEGAMGIEVLCHEHDSASVERFSEMADRYGLLKTGGSDTTAKCWSSPSASGISRYRIGSISSSRRPRTTCRCAIEIIPDRRHLDR